MKKVPDLVGAELDYWVAKAEGKTLVPDGDGGWFDENGFEYSPSAEWSDGGPILERELISCESYLKDPPVWRARDWAYEFSCDGPTMLVAGMRCFVGSRFGEEIDDSQTHHI